MASRSPLPSKWGRREDDNDERRRRKKLDKGKEPTAKDTKFAIELLRSAFRKLEGVGKAFDIMAHHDVYKDPSVKGLAFRIHGLAGKLENLPVVKRVARPTSSSTTTAPTATTAATTATATDTTAMAATTAGLRVIDRLLYQLVTIMSVCFCVFVRFLDMNCFVCLSIMNW
jgi:hypothetical protein